MLERDIRFRTTIERFGFGLFAQRLVIEDLLGDIDRCLMTTECLRTTQDTQTGNDRVLAGRSQTMHAVEGLQRTVIIGFVVTDLRHTRSRFLLIRIGVHLREHLILLQRLRTLSETVVRIREVVTRRGAITASGAELRDIIAERNGCFAVIGLHVLHLGGRVEERVLGGRDVHVHTREVLGVLEVLVHVSGLHIECLQGIESGVRLFGSRIFLDRLTIGRDRLLVLMEVTIEHRALQRRFARQSRVRIGRKQLTVRAYCRTLIVLLELGTGNLIDTVIGIVGLGIAADEFTKNGDLIAVLMLQA